MKINNVLKIGFFAVAFALLSVGVKAQTPILPSTPTPVPDESYTEFTGVNAIDTVTVGSKMAYKQDGDPAVNALIGTEATKLFNPSYFKWLFTGSVSIINPADGLAATPASSETIYYNNLKEVYAIISSGAGTLIDLTVNEKSRPKNGTGCEGTDLTKQIRVVARPTVQWGTTDRITAGCASTAVSIPLTVTGYSKFEVTYSVKYFANIDKTGTPTTTPANVVLTGNSLDFLATAFPTTGAYEITITNITDRISRKSLDLSLVASQAGDIPTDAYTVYVYPAPVTNKLQHVKN